MELDLYSQISNDIPVDTQIIALRENIYKDSVKYRNKANVHLFLFQMVEYLMGIALTINTIGSFFYQGTTTGKIMSVILFAIKMLSVFDLKKRWNSNKDMSNKLKKLLGKLDRALLHSEQEIKLDYYLDIRDKLIDLEYDMYQSFSYL